MCSKPYSLPSKNDSSRDILWYESGIELSFLSEDITALSSINDVIFSSPSITGVNKTGSCCLLFFDPLIVSICFVLVFLRFTSGTFSDAVDFRLQDTVFVDEVPCLIGLSIFLYRVCLRVGL